jgi:hypothetical protein
MAIALALTLPAGQHDVLRLAGWFKFLIRHTHQIELREAFSDSGT